jgi:hypothetical protein
VFDGAYQRFSVLPRGEEIDRPREDPVSHQPDSKEQDLPGF